MNPEPSRPRDLSALRIDGRDEPRRRKGLPVAAVLAVVALALGAIAWPVVRGLGLLVPQVEVGSVLLERPTGAAESLLTASGYVVPRTKASISSKVAGRLESLTVHEGSEVVRGQVLARLQSEDRRADVDAAAAALGQLRASLLRAQAQLDAATLERDRQASLFAAGVGSRNASDTAAAQWRGATAAVTEAEAAVGSGAARLQSAQVALEDTIVRAPFDGTILRKEAEEGESVAPAVAAGQLTRGAIVTMADLRALDVEADVSEANISRVHEGQPAEVALDAVADRRYRGRVRQVQPTADRQKATVQVKVEILDADARVKPEMSAKTSFLSGEPDPAALSAPPVVTAPRRGVVVEGSEAFAWTVLDGRVSRRALQLGEPRGDRIVVLSGLDGGESVVLGPPGKLKDGDRVKVKAP